MNNQKLNNLLKDPNTNWKYIALVAVLTLLVSGGILGYQYLFCGEALRDWWASKQEVGAPEVKVPEEVVPPEEIATEEGVAIVHTYFKVKPLGVVSEPLLEGPTDRYWCNSDDDCAYIIDNGDCNFLPENDCGNVAKYGFKVKEGKIQKPATETIEGLLGEGVTNDCDVSKIVIDPYINCECAAHAVLPTTPCSTDSDTGEEVCVWIEDVYDYTICTKSKDQTKPDIAVTNFEFTPANLSVGQAYDFSVTVKNAGDSYCSSLMVWIAPFAGFGTPEEIGKTVRYSWCTHYYSLEYCMEHYKIYAFLPRSEFTDKESCSSEECIDNPIPGSYTVRAYAECVDPHVDSDWSNNSFETTITVLP